MSITRREFAAGALAGAILAPGRVLGANDRIRAGFIGVANRGSQLLDAALPNKDLEVVAICDVYEPVRDKWAAKIGSGCQKYNDYRAMIDRKDIDAIFIATPDQWHALQCINACEAGKDVYCEKPLSYTIHEGRKMVDAARRHNRIVQTGTQRRSSHHYAEMVRLIQSGAIGKVTVARAYRITNMSPKGIGLDPDSDPPPGLDWDMWLGPRPKRPFNKNIAPYKFRWWKSYSSQMANWGVHYFDCLRWMLGVDAPTSVVAVGGKYALNDARDIPDTMEAIFELPGGCLMIFGQYEASGHPALDREIELRGTNGVLIADSKGYQIVPDKGGQFQDPGPKLKSSPPVMSTNGDGEKDHVRNFLDCVKTRQTPNADVEIGHRSTTFAHLGNISLATRQRIEWDARTETITSPRAANSLLHYTYRAPWKLS